MRKTNLLLWKIHDPIQRYPGSQIIEFVIQKIQSNEVSPGERLPSQLAFSKLNNINSNTVRRAYAKLIVKGWLTTQLSSGTFVKRNVNEVERVFTSNEFVNELPINIKSNREITLFSDTMIQDFAAIGLTSLNPYHYPERPMFKFRSLHRNRYRNITQADQIADLNGIAYKEAIRSYFNNYRNFKLNKGCMDIVFGREESLTRVFYTLLNPGDYVVSTSPKDVLLSEVLHKAQAQSLNLSTLDVDFIEKLEDLVKVADIKVLYLSPQCGYPECNVLSVDDCMKVLELAKKYKFYIVEEDDYHEFWYRTDSYKPLARYDHESYVIYIGALSQLSVYMRNTRVICAAMDFIALMPHRPYEFRDLLEENAIIEMINCGDLWYYAQQARKIKERDRDNLLWVLRNYLDEFMEIQAPDSGLAFWIRLPEFSSLRNSVDFLKENEIVVPYDPGMPFNDFEVYDMYLGFGTYNKVEAETAVKILWERFKSLKKKGLR